MISEMVLREELLEAREAQAIKIMRRYLLENNYSLDELLASTEAAWARYNTLKKAVEALQPKANLVNNHFFLLEQEMKEPGHPQYSIKRFKEVQQSWNSLKSAIGLLDGVA